jgi:hypothetical protein
LKMWAINRGFMLFFLRKRRFRLMGGSGMECD